VRRCTSAPARESACPEIGGHGCSRGAQRAVNVLPLVLRSSRFDDGFLGPTAAVSLSRESACGLHGSSQDCAHLRPPRVLQRPRRCSSATLLNARSFPSTTDTTMSGLYSFSVVRSFLVSRSQLFSLYPVLLAHGRRMGGVWRSSWQSHTSCCSQLFGASQPPAAAACSSSVYSTVRPT